MKKSIIYIFVFVALGFYSESKAQITHRVKQNIEFIKKNESAYIGKPIGLLLNDFNTDIKAYRTGLLDDGLAFISLYFENENSIREKKSRKISYSVFTVFLDTSITERDNLFRNLNDKKFYQYKGNNLDIYENLIVIGFTSYVEK